MWNRMCADLLWMADSGVMYNIINIPCTIPKNAYITVWRVAYYESINFSTYSPAEEGRRIVVPGLPGAADTPGA